LPHEKTTSIKSAVINFYRRKRTFEKQQVLNNISFEIEKGEFFGIVGRNGSGKSTLLKLLAGIYSPDKGSIRVNGKLTPFIELGVGFSPELTGRENVFLNGALLGFSRKEMEAMYDEIVDFAELHRFMDQKLKNYSSGMQVRLAFSIAVRAKGDILLLDEVLAVGDEAFQNKCFKYFDQLKKQSKTVIFVTHDMGAFEKYCDRGILIDSGEIIHKGVPSLLSAEYKMLNSIKEKRSTGKATELSFDDSIQSVKLNGMSTAVLNHGDMLEIGITVRPKKTTDIAAGVSIIRSDGVYVAFHNTRTALKKTQAKAGTQSTFTYKLQSDQLLPGAYVIDIALYDENNNYIDLKNHAGKFVILGEDRTRAGIVKLEGSWSFDE
jgi:ABC-2 type transport system ATP-binding protein